MSFMLAFATARNIALYTEARLGQLWQVLTPLLNAGVYFLIFGLLLHINRGIPNYLAFLVTGVFVFNFTQRAFITTSKVITDSLPLIRALQFPRAALPLAYVMIELQQMLLSMAVLVRHPAGHRRAADLVLAAGDPGAAPADGVQRRRGPAGGAGSAPRSTTSASCCRSCCAPGCTLSGVIFSITALAISTHRWAIALLQINPAAVYISLMRSSLMLSDRLSQPGSQPYNAQVPHVPGREGAP